MCYGGVLTKAMRFDEIKLNFKWCFFKKIFILLKLITLLLFLGCFDVLIF